MTLLDTLCVEITARCPLRCLHCSVGAGPERHEFLELDTFEACLAQLPHLSEIYLSGGEPFDHPSFLKFVSRAKRAAARVVAYSSGTARAGDHLAPLSEDSISAAAIAGIDRVDVSLYASSALDHDRVTQTPGSFETTLTTLRRLRLLGVPFGIHYVPVADHGGNVLSVLGLARMLGASRFHVLALAAQGRARSISDATPRLSFYEDVRELWTGGSSGPRIVLSSRTRRAAGIDEVTQRDLLRAAMLDSTGFLYPGEGKRQPEFRTSRRIAGGVPVAELLSELTSG